MKGALIGSRRKNVKEKKDNHPSPTGAFSPETKPRNQMKTCHRKKSPFLFYIIRMTKLFIFFLFYCARVLSFEREKCGKSSVSFEFGLGMFFFHYYFL